MADREFVFNNPEVQAALREGFVPLAMNDWYLRRQEDDAGRFFRSVADQGDRTGEDGATRQGRYVFTAKGKLLGFNNNRGPERLLKMLRETRQKWNALPEQERAYVVADPWTSSDKTYARPLPDGAAVVKVHTRVLEERDGELAHCIIDQVSEKDPYQHRGFAAAIDHLWLRAEEIASLEKIGTESVPLPRELAMRLLRFHLTDSTRGEPPFWSKKEVKEANFTLARNVDGTLAVEGTFHLETADADRGYQGSLRGTLAFQKGRLTQFDAVALGEHWGEGRYTRGARPGRTPLGVAFSLVEKPAPADLIAPQAASWMDGYWRADR